MSQNKHPNRSEFAGFNPKSRKPNGDKPMPVPGLNLDGFEAQTKRERDLAALAKTQASRPLKPPGGKRW